MKKLVETFGLKTEVESFVAGRVREIVADKRHDFRFEGSNGTYHCPNVEPHAPHVRSHYETVRYGRLEKFCLGRAGQTEAGELEVIVEKITPGAPEYPGDARGYWFVH